VTVRLILDLESSFRKCENGKGISMIVKHAIPYVPLLRTGKARLDHSSVRLEFDNATRAFPTPDQLFFDPGVIGVSVCGREKRRTY
jgi:hypothetical protein